MVNQINNARFQRLGQVLLILLPAVLAIVAVFWPIDGILLLMLCASLAGGLFCCMPLMRSLRQMFATTTVIAIVLSVGISNWPLQAAYRVSRPALDQMANDLRAGNTIDTPRMAGLFRVKKAEVNRNGVVCLWTNVVPSGNSGFVQCGPIDPPFNLWSHCALDEDWQYIKED